MLANLPSRLPSFDLLVQDMLAPPDEIAKALGVTVTTFKRWCRSGDPPRSVVLALYWLSRWGQHDLDADLYNRAQMLQALADSRAREIRSLNAKLARLSALGSFGAANDPLVDVHITPGDLPARPVSPARPEPVFQPLHVNLAAAV